MDHSRFIEIGFESGKILTVRFDQGVSYWRSAYKNPKKLTYFDLYSEDIEGQSSHLAELNIIIEGSALPTYLFVRVK